MLAKLPSVHMSNKRVHQSCQFQFNNVTQPCMTNSIFLFSLALAQSFEELMNYIHVKEGGKKRRHNVLPVQTFQTTFIVHFPSPVSLQSRSNTCMHPERFVHSSRNSPDSVQCARKLPPSSMLIGYSANQSERNEQQVQQP